MSYTEEEIKAAGLDDFRVFLRQVWDFLGLPPPTPVQNDIAYRLQHGPRRQIIQAFRGVGKSWITVAFVLWLLFLNPNLKIMVVSASSGLANDFSKFCRSLIDGMPMLQHLRPRPNQTDTAILFDVGPAGLSKDHSVKSVGINGQLTGSRADVIIGDDVEIPRNALTPDSREKLSEQVKEFDAVLKPGGRVLYLGTPQVEATLYRRLETRGYETMVWPSEIPVNTERYRGRLANFVMKLIASGAKPGEPTDSKRFSKADLLERLASYARSGYALQFMLDTSISDDERHPLKLRDMMVWDVDKDQAPVKFIWGNSAELSLRDLPSLGMEGDWWYKPARVEDQYAAFTGTVMAIDPSGKGTDETAYAIVKMLYGQLYLVASGGLRDGYSEATLTTLALKAARYGVNDVVIEENFGGGMFNQLFKPVLQAHSKARILEKGDERWDGWSSAQKDARIVDTLEPVLNSHLLIVDRRVIAEDAKLADSENEGEEKYSLFYQLSRITREKGSLVKYDRVDALAMAVSYWKRILDRDQNKVIKVASDSRKLEQAREFIKGKMALFGNSRMGGFDGPNILDR